MALLGPEHQGAPFDFMGDQETVRIEIGAHARGHFRAVRIETAVVRFQFFYDQWSETMELLRRCALQYHALVARVGHKVKCRGYRTRIANRAERIELRTCSRTIAGRGSPLERLLSF